MLTQIVMPISRRHFLAFSIALTPVLSLAKSNLQQQLNALVKRQRSDGRVSNNERTAWVVYDLTSQQKRVAINAERPMQLASIVKLFVALAYFYLHEQTPKKYPYGKKQRKMMEQMLVDSDNDATNTVIRWCKGPKNIQRLAQIASKQPFSQLRIVENIPDGGRTYRNKASANDLSRYFHALWHNELPNSKELKRILSIKNIDRITTPDMRADGTVVYDKTGSTGRLCGDAGIIQIAGGEQAYIFVGIIERRNKAANFARWVASRDRVMQEVSDLVYRVIKG